MKKFILILAGLYLLFSGYSSMAQYNISVVDSTSDGIIKSAIVEKQYQNLEKFESKVFLKNVLKVENGTDFYLYKITTDELGMTHEKYQQTYSGIKVEFGEFIVHKDKSGNIVSINGDFAPLPKSFNITPKLEFIDALNKIAASKKIKEYHVGDLPEEKSTEKVITHRGDKYEIVIVRGYDNQWHLAYKANLTGNNIMDNFYGYIDCETGDMVFVQPLVYRTNSTGTASTIYSGNRTITSDSYSGSFRLQETSRGGTNTAIQNL